MGPGDRVSDTRAGEIPTIRPGAGRRPMTGVLGQAHRLPIGDSGDSPGLYSV